jgi:hypothetical protein
MPSLLHAAAKVQGLDSQQQSTPKRAIAAQTIYTHNTQPNAAAIPHPLVPLVFSARDRMQMLHARLPHNTPGRLYQCCSAV